MNKIVHDFVGLIMDNKGVNTKEEIIEIINELKSIIKNHNEYINKFDLIHSKDIIEILENRLNI